MAFEQCFVDDWKSISPAAAAAAAEAEIENISGGFDCNICLDFASEPVVTLCGHLYCWPCIYKWFHFQSSSLSSDDHTQCPVCKSEISTATVVPLYVHGHTPKEAQLEAKSPSPDVTIPPRPPACGNKLLAISSPQYPHVSSRNPHQNQHYEADVSPLPPSFNISDSTGMGGLNPGVGMFGEMVYARVFGNSDRSYAYPNSYHLTASSSPRLRRHEMQADKSLNRVTMFLFCCFLLCLLLF